MREKNKSKNFLAMENVPASDMLKTKHLSYLRYTHKIVIVYLNKTN